MKDYTLYQGIENKRKIYVVVSAEVHPEEAIRIANRHLKESFGHIKIEAGYVLRKELYLGYSDDKKSTPVWVVTRK